MALGIKKTRSVAIMSLLKNPSGTYLLFSELTFGIIILVSGFNVSLKREGVAALILQRE